jgi:hypothetical protein
VQFHRIEPHLHAIAISAGRNFAIDRKQCQLAVPSAAFIKGFDQLAPSLALAVIDLAKVQHLPLDHLATDAAARANFRAGPRAAPPSARS